MQSARNALNIIIAIFLLAFIGMNLLRLGALLLSSQHLI